LLGQVLPGTSTEATTVDATDHVLMEQQDGTLLLYVNDVNDAAAHGTSNTADVSAVSVIYMFSFAFSWTEIS